MQYNIIAWQLIAKRCGSLARYAPVSESTVVLSIIIGIAMVVLPYIGPMGKQFPLNLIYTNAKVENILQANNI